MKHLLQLSQLICRLKYIHSLMLISDGEAFFKKLIIIFCLWFVVFQAAKIMKSRLPPLLSWKKSFFFLCIHICNSGQGCLFFLNPSKLKIAINNAKECIFSLQFWGEHTCACCYQCISDYRTSYGQTLRKRSAFSPSICPENIIPRPFQTEKKRAGSSGTQNCMLFHTFVKNLTYLY